MAWSDPKTWTADELLTASDMNQYLSDNLSALYALVQGGGRKNLLHNGAMQVHQRGTSYAGDTTGGYRTVDRWQGIAAGIGTYTYSVESDAPTGSGFRKSLKVLCTTADASPAAGDYLDFRQAIEGQNLQTIKKGTTSAEQLTLSFWTKSNKTGTYVVQLRDDDNTRNVSATYTVVALDTWEQQSITFPADLTGAFDNDNAASMTLRFILAAGSVYTSGTLATTWGANTAANTAVGQTNLAAANNNYWMVTGAQLEIGSAATGFEHKDYGTELAECQRYYYHHVSANGQLVGMGFFNANADPSTSLYVTVAFPVTMRTAPVPAVSSGANHWYVLVRDTSDQFDTFDASYNASPSACVLAASAATGVSVASAFGYPCIVTATNAASSVAFSADLQ